MRILHVITGMQKAAGTSVFCGELANELVARGHDVTIAVCNPTSPNCYALDPRVRLVSIESILHSTPTPSFYTLIHIHALWSPALHRVAKWARQNGIPVVWSPHGMLQKWALKNKWWKKFAALALYQWHDLHSAALLHATAQSEVEDIRRIGLRNKVVTAPLGVRISSSVGRDVLSAPEKKTKTLLFVSRVQRKKGLPNLIEAWSRLPQDLRKGWQIRIVGPDQDNHIAELKAQCDRLGLAYKDETVHCATTPPDYDFIFTGPKYDSDLDAEYSNADLFVLPTHSENFGSVVIEALAHGVPVITTKQAPWAELEEFKCGWWIDDNVDALVLALKEALSLHCTTTTPCIAPAAQLASLGGYSDWLAQMGERGRALVESRYTWSAVCDKMLCGYEGVLK